MAELIKPNAHGTVHVQLSVPMALPQVIEIVKSIGMALNNTVLDERIERRKHWAKLNVVHAIEELEKAQKLLEANGE